MHPLLIDALEQGLYLVLLVTIPPLLAIGAAGALMGLLQAVTRVQDPSLGTGARIAVALGSLAVMGPWIGEQVAAFAGAVLRAVARV